MGNSTSGCFAGVSVGELFLWFRDDKFLNSFAIRVLMEVLKECHTEFTTGTPCKCVHPACAAACAGFVWSKMRNCRQKEPLHARKVVQSVKLSSKVAFACQKSCPKYDEFLVNYILFWPWNCQNGFKPCKLHIILALELFNMESYISPCKTHTFLAWSCMESARIGSYAVNYILFWPRNEFCPVNYITYWTH
jgi:hypothetical protein